MKRPILNQLQRQIILHTDSMLRERYLIYLAKLNFKREFEKTGLYKLMVRISDYLNSKL